jgi:hypothetical protein
MYRRLIALLMAFLPTASVLAWGPRGHQIVGALAQRDLSPAAAAQVAALLGAESLASVANLPDDWRPDHPETAPWHFADIPTTETSFVPSRDCTDQTCTGNCPTDACVVAKILHFEQVLADTTNSVAVRREALTYLTHFVGDIHQPLHTAARFNPDGTDDSGGAITVTFFGQVIHYGTKKWKLHAVWDSGMINHTGLDVDAYVDYLADQQLGHRTVAELQVGTPEEWANESHALAISYAYVIPSNKRLGAAYQNRNEPVVDEQLLRAGLRLRRLIEQALGNANGIHTLDAPGTFHPPCSPFPLVLANPSTFADDDTHEDCGNAGVPTDDAHRQQNQAKNNLCATAPRVTVTPFTLLALQETTDDQHIAGPPANRAVLADLRTTTDGMAVGEGTLVVLTGWLLRAKGTGAESVNCGATSVAQTDIHLAIAKDPFETNECYSATAEMIPHHRPESWHPGAFHYLAKLKPKKKNSSDTLEYTDYATNDRPPVRVTGQLFFDGSHKVCDGGTPRSGQPPRYANWEIHPVYNFEVCTASDYAQCTPTNDSVWTSVENWEP